MPRLTAKAKVRAIKDMETLMLRSSKFAEHAAKEVSKNWEKEHKTFCFGHVTLRRWMKKKIAIEEAAAAEPPSDSIWARPEQQGMKELTTKDRKELISKDERRTQQRKEYEEQEHVKQQRKEYREQEHVKQHAKEYREQEHVKQHYKQHAKEYEKQEHRKQQHKEYREQEHVKQHAKEYREQEHVKQRKHDLSVKRSSALAQFAQRKVESLAEESLKTTRDEQIITGIAHNISVIQELCARARREGTILVFQVFFASPGTLLNEKKPEAFRPLMDGSTSCCLKPNTAINSRFKLEQLEALGWEQPVPAFASCGPWARAIENGVQDWAFDNIPSLAYYNPSSEHSVYHINVVPGAGTHMQEVGISAAGVAYSFATLVAQPLGAPTCAPGACLRPVRHGQQQPRARHVRLEADEAAGWRLEEALSRLARQAGPSSVAPQLVELPEAPEMPEPALGEHVLLCLESRDGVARDAYHTYAVDRQHEENRYLISHWKGSSTAPTAPFPARVESWFEKSKEDVHLLLQRRIERETLGRGKSSAKEAAKRYIVVLHWTVFGDGIALSPSASNRVALQARLDKIVASSPETVQAEPKAEERTAAGGGLDDAVEEDSESSDGGSSEEEEDDNEEEEEEEVDPSDDDDERRAPPSEPLRRAAAGEVVGSRVVVRYLEGGATVAYPGRVLDYQAPGARSRGAAAETCGLLVRFDGHGPEDDTWVEEAGEDEWCWEADWVAPQSGKAKSKRASASAPAAMPAAKAPKRHAARSSTRASSRRTS